MGQYYKAILRKDNDTPRGVFDPRDYGDGRKLMEHTLLSKHFVEAVMDVIGRVKQGLKVIWAGDYGSTKQSLSGDLKPYEFTKTIGKNEITSVTANKYLVNEDKKEYVDLAEVAKMTDIHPLPILTSDGNGMGGGDYFSDVCKEYIGYWWNDRIRVTDETPNSTYKKISAAFREE